MAGKLYSVNSDVIGNAGMRATTINLMATRPSGLRSFKVKQRDFEILERFMGGEERVRW